VGIGTSTPDAKLHVVGAVKIAGTTTINSGRIDTNGDANFPRFLDLNDTNYYVDPDATSNLKKLRVINPSSDFNVNPAIYGQDDVNDFYGVGVKGVGGFIGVSGEVWPTGSRVYFGLHGSANGGSGDNHGVKGEASGSGRNYGVKGEAVGFPGTSYGVHGSGRNYGVYGEATSSSTNYGVYGISNTSTNNYAGYFSGNVHVTGILSKGGGSFLIDHPLDPENKSLYHSFVESPDMMNIYNGMVILDDDGAAWVELPDWFEALNMDFRYQLTCIGGYAPVYIAEEISTNKFKIAGGKPGLKISWQVTGIRHDPFAEKYRIPVEEDKKLDKIGRYHHPDVYGKSDEWSMHPSPQQDEKLEKTKSRKE
jgi:hypothetical protein